jgi:hypothetical protein
VLLLTWAPVAAGEPFRYPEARHGKGELKYVNGVPVVILAGSPAEMGEQMAVLTAKPASRLLTFPKDFLKSEGMEGAWPALVLVGRAMLPQFPADYRNELEAAVKTSGLDRDSVIVGNTMFDIKKLTGCSALLVDAAHSATKGPLFGRNLDLPTLGYLQEYSVVVVSRPKGKHAFVSIGFPGILGCLSGMNDAGLTLATLEVFSSREGAAKVDLRGTPYALCYRRLLEECSTVAEAEKLLRSMKRTTLNNLAICDRNGAAAVFEITPKAVVVREPVDGICAATNHFRSKELATSLGCPRYLALEKSRHQGTLDLAAVAERLHAANQGNMTLQTMIFEPAVLKLHLAIGKCPSSALPMKELDLTPLFKTHSEKE